MFTAVYVGNVSVWHCETESFVAVQSMATGGTGDTITSPIRIKPGATGINGLGGLSHS